MKKYLAAVLWLVLPVLAWAHPPKQVDLKYDSECRELVVEAVHPVGDVKSHYIKQVDISLNGKKVKTIEAEEQCSEEKARFVYEIGALKSGDKVKVRARCNKPGRRTVTLIIE